MFWWAEAGSDDLENIIANSLEHVKDGHHNKIYDNEIAGDNIWPSRMLIPQTGRCSEIS